MIHRIMFDNYIDFDEASREWRKNKKKQPNGQFVYVCNYVHSNGKQCRKIVVASWLQNNYVYGFGGYSFIDKYGNYPKWIHHPNKNYYCKRHINRYKPTF